MDLTTAKAVAMLSLGLGSFISGMVPAFFSERTRQRHPLFVSCLLCFGGGVLLATSLVHMLPEAREQYPMYAELMFCLGFFLVYFVDELVHLFYGPGNDPHGSNYGSTERTSLLHEAPRVEDGELGVQCGDTEANQRMCHVNHTAPCNKTVSGVIGLLSALFVHSLLEGLAIGLQEVPSQVLVLLGAVASHKFVVGFCLGAELCASAPGRLCAHMVCVLLFSGGSVAGIGIGAGLDTVTGLKDSVAIPIMQLGAALCACAHMVCIMQFSGSSGVGIEIGASLDPTVTTLKGFVAIPIMQALAAGTLLYVTVSEVLPRERAHWHKRKRTAGAMQFFAVGVGFAIMYLATMYLDED